MQSGVRGHSEFTVPGSALGASPRSAAVSRSATSLEASAEISSRVLSFVSGILVCVRACVIGGYVFWTPHRVPSFPCWRFVGFWWLVSEEKTIKRSRKQSGDGHPRWGGGGGVRVKDLKGSRKKGFPAG